MICPNWLLCRCNYSGGFCNHNTPHSKIAEGNDRENNDRTSCRRTHFPCDVIGYSSGWCLNFNKKYDCARRKMEGCVEVHETTEDALPELDSLRE